MGMFFLAGDGFAADIDMTAANVTIMIRHIFLVITLLFFRARSMTFAIAKFSIKQGISIQTISVMHIAKSLLYYLLIELRTKLLKSPLNTNLLKSNKPNFVLTFSKSAKNLHTPSAVCAGSLIPITNYLSSKSNAPEIPGQLLRLSSTPGQPPSVGC